MKFVVSVAVVAVGLLPATAAAQTVATTFDDLGRAVKLGQKVIVTDVNGEKVNGKISAVSPTSITVLVSDYGTDRPISFDHHAVRTIRKNDSVWNGLLIGLGAGIVASQVWLRQTCGAPGYDEECAVIVNAVGLGTFVPGGAAVGALIDKFTGNRLLYQGVGTKSTLRLMPMIGPARTGLAVSVSF